ncbi:DNA adenine methylase [Klebsiella michiganensis]|uniref:DNA adenine methylase n=1 Tax=Klebsiella michiganensis TaxID=1134687 RepID=UPI000D655D13|nr:DNA adenine methylase [Klebsiella michiganensis]HDK6380764.1 DNA adenine methylase [Klebsiella pneumoniae]ELB7345293.1 DNA adenine methylase [Klebsiella michiganensis]ELC2234243.1 DNA adenine methylase [Klebsiella michiganensis]ELJ6256975.1 DNA adenine methylase [Klebsiella michiganensis]MDQ2146549.1 DNA adenine methylase [Klebsiella michiganensis]
MNGLIASEDNQPTKGGTFGTPLRYPGGKGRLSLWLSQLIRENGLNDGWYVEPYAGGAGAAILLLCGGHVDRIVLNDLDPAIHAFWWAVLNDTDNLLRLIDEAQPTLETWEAQRAVHADPQNHSPTEVGFATFYLNRTNRSGILRGGLIGGKAQTGKWLMFARFNKPDLSLRIRNIARLKRHISLYNEDAQDLISGLKSDLPARSLIYFDPPYYHKGNQLYRNHYKASDHASIAAQVETITTPWLVTYDNCEEIREIYAGKQNIEFSLHYSTASTRPLVSEIMFYGNLSLHAKPTMSRRFPQGT